MITLILLKFALVLVLIVCAFIAFIVGVAILLMPKGEYERACEKGNLHDALLKYELKSRWIALAIVILLTALFFDFGGLNV